MTADEVLPRVVGPARLERRLGAGGMGTVYEAVLLSSVAGLPEGSAVAAKILHPERLDGERGVARVRREAEIGARIEHRAVVRPHELVEGIDGGRPCLVLLMELVRGTTLRELMSGMGTLPEPLLRHVAIQLADGLAAVHAHGIVHRDVKPENVLIDGEHQVKLSDLGIARSWAESSDLTTTGAFLGSVAYASPEHLGQGTLGPGSDLYSLGVLLYEAVAGRRPFEHPSIGGLVRLHLERRPQPLGEVAVQVSPFLEALVAWLLEKDPVRRPASASGVASLLREGEGSAWWSELEGRGAEAPRRRPRTAADSRLVGRTAELATLGALAERALSGDGGSVLVEGEAGVGKTRLVDEALDALEASRGSTVVLRGDCAARSGRGAVADALIAHLGEATLSQALSRLLPATPTLVAPLASWLLGSPSPDGQGLGRDALHGALARLAAALSRERPVAWIFEDLHFATPEERSLVLTLRRSAAGQPMLVIATTRPGLPPEDLAAWERGGGQRLALARLSARSVIELLVGVLGSQGLAEDLGGRVAAKTDGNPYFVLEVARDLKQRGFVTRRADGTWSARQRISAIEVPTSVRTLLLDRVAAVPADQRAILDVAAVQGFRFDGDLTARVLGSSRLAVLQSLAVLERSFGLVRTKGAEYHFDHHQLQEVLLDAIPLPLRVEYHALVAQALAARAEGAIEGEPAVRLVRHALEGGLHAIAASHLRAALDHLRSRQAFEATVELGRLATGRLAAPAEVRSLAFTRVSLALEKLARLDEALAEGEQGLALAVACGDAILEGQARQAIVAALFHLGRFRDAREMSRLGVEAAASAGDRLTEGKLQGSLGIIAAFEGRHDEAEAFLRRSVATLRAQGAKGNLAVSLGNLANVLRDARRPGSVELLRDAIAIAEEVGELGHATLLEGNLGSGLLQDAQWEAGEAHVRRSLQRSRELGMVRTEAGNLLRLLELALTLGDMEGAERLVPETTEVATTARDRRVLGKAIGAGGDVARFRGRPEEARAKYDEGLEVLRSTRAAVDMVPSLLRRARFAWDEGAAATARALVAEARAIVPKEDAHLAAWETLVLGSPPPFVEVVAALPPLVRLEAQALLGKAGDPTQAVAARDLAERLAAPLPAKARERFLRDGAGRWALR